MIELTLLGLQAVRGSDGREFGSLPAQPKRFALLAYLAISGGGGFHRRDSLAAMFWPDLDQFAARRALRNTLYHLREAIGDGILIGQGDDALSIDPERMTCDVTRLATAVTEGRYEEAVDLYRGELLAGMHFANAGEAFEDWLHRERTRVAELVLRAVSALVDREERAANLAGAAYWAQRACALAPDDEKWLRRAMTMLEASDDRGNALRLYDAFARRLATELQSKPSAESTALATRIREGSGPPKNRTAASPASVTEGDAKAAPERVAVVEATPPAAPNAPPAQASARTGDPADAAPPRGRHGRRWAALAAGITVVVAALILRTLNVSHARAPARTRVLVAMFGNRTGDARLDALGPMAEDWLSQGLLRTQVVDVVDPRAVLVQSRASGGEAVDPVTLGHRTGAAMVVSGNYYLTGDSVLFQSLLTDVGSGRIVRVVGPIGAPIGAVVSAIDELRSRVMTALASQLNEGGPGRLEPGFNAEIPPFEVYQEYVEGRDAFDHGDPRALSLFLDASRRDPAFTNAAIAAAVVASNSGRCAVVDSIARALSSAARPLGRIERLTLQIGVARCHGRNDELLRLTLERAELAPRTSSMRLNAAAAALYANQPKRALQLMKSIDPSTELSWSTDSSHFGYWSGITEALHILGRHSEELAEANAMPNVAPLSRSWLRARSLAALQRPADVLAVIDTALTQQTETSNNLGLAPYSSGRPQYAATPAWIAVWVARELAVHGDTLASRQVAARALAWYRARPAEERSTNEERLVAAWSLELMGSYADADRMTRTLAAEDSTNIDYQGELAGLAAERGDGARSDSIDQWLSHQHGDAVSWTASYYRARDAALLSRDSAAIALLRQCMDEGAWPYYLLNEPAFARLRANAAFASLIAPKG
jgi:DNA-binding SARP family transcriptional activator/TolB-like protein